MNFAIIGAGAWGTAFAIHLSRLNHTVTLVPRRFEQALAIASTRENADYLPGIPLPLSIQIGHELTPVLMEADVIILACPSQALRETCERVKANLGLATQLKLIVSLSKGLELGTHLRPSEVIAAVLPQVSAGSLSGPTNAAEVAKGKPAAMVLAVTKADAFLAEVQAALSGPTLRVYTSDDVAGVELGGALKNVYAIAAGCCDGLKLGDNTKAALLTRALAEMVRVGVALGAKAETFYGLGGFGDLVATCTGAWSRNRTFGQHLGEGKTAADLIAASKSVVEGYRTTESFNGLVTQRGIDAPILAETYRILYDHKPVGEALHALMTRELKKE
ncbi:NAD(P)H-dependent glycerol-3-phosphate dehydrogenase [Rariglobus hedericola]|uniref:Glycerol-3-phosphate dehydrogenase [NAD(P)+] n=1 Tax=Rariglobus hedericola TaxID=2597822 RepID=A0A556QJN2_9BACT|nr:NAD(P)H-dependent glycerol-3-phosphate dehydrogenase [Rariglobus hedericola]TSJ76821.1 NAD(P)-dependent glycerol-3-phosphate dehydrogenase [Rariglobus hedericola]